MADQIIPLHCPACGSSKNEGLRERAFGGEIKCKNCGVTSVLVVDNQWHQKKTGEYVCSTCGRIALSGARFCECSKSLIRPCLVCANEFFVGSNVCPNCGWNHSCELSNETAQVALALKLQGWPQTKIYGPEFRLLQESIALCPKLTSEAETYIKKMVAGEWEMSIRFTNRTNELWNYKDRVYSGWLFSTSKLESVAAWVREWHSEITKIQADLERARKGLEVNIVTRIFGTHRAQAAIQALESKLASINQRYGLNSLL